MLIIQTLLVALKGCQQKKYRMLFLRTFQSVLLLMIKEDMDFMGPVRMKDVEEAQQKIVNIHQKA